MHEKGVILNLVDKVLRLSETVHYQKNLEHLIAVLLNNGYPLELILYTINKKLKSWIHGELDSSNSGQKEVSNSSSSSFFVIPYVKEVSEKFVTVFKKHKLKLVYSCKNRLDKFIKTGKDVVDPMFQCGVIYKISCDDYDAIYVGQTKRASYKSYKRTSYK